MTKRILVTLMARVLVMALVILATVMMGMVTQIVIVVLTDGTDEYMTIASDDFVREHRSWQVSLH